MAFAKDIVKLASGSTLAQVINVFSVPILTRLFMPEEFGVAALFIAIIGFIGPIMCLRYELGIMLPKSDVKAASVFWLCVSILSVLTCIACLVVISDKYIFHFILNKKMSKYYYLIPLGLFLQGLLLIFNLWCSRRKYFGFLAVNQALRSTSSNAIKLICGFQGLISSGYLIIGDLSGRAIQAISLLRKVLKVDKSTLIKRVSLRRILQIAKEYKKFPLYSSWGIFFNSLSKQLPILLLAYFFESKIVGFYAIARNILMIPSNMIAGAISQVLFQKASQLYSDKIIPTELVSQIVVKILITGIFPCLVLIFYGKDILSIVLGKTWGDTGLYIQIMAPMILFGFIGTSIGNLYHVYQKQEVAFYINIVRGITIAVVLLVGGKTGNIIVTLLLLSLSDMLVRIFGIGWILIKSQVNIKNIIYSALKYLFFGSTLILSIFFVTTNISNSIFLLFGLLIIATAIYYIIFIDNQITPFIRIKSKAP